MLVAPDAPTAGNKPDGKVAHVQLVGNGGNWKP
jgi:hypothetical protein